MKRKYKRYKHLTKSGSIALLRAKGERAVQRETRATELRQRLASEYRTVHNLPEDVPIPAADEALLESAISAGVEIARTTELMIKGCARPASVKSLGFARSELRRSLRALGMVSDSAIEQREDSTTPPLLPSEEAMREVVASFGGAIKEAASGSS